MNDLVENAAKGPNIGPVAESSLPGTKLFYLRGTITGGPPCIRCCRCGRYALQGEAKVSEHPRVVQTAVKD
jgi:hypothetical protein